MSGDFNRKHLCKIELCRHRHCIGSDEIVRVRTSCDLNERARSMWFIREKKQCRFLMEKPRHNKTDTTTNNFNRMNQLEQALTPYL